MSPLVAQSQDTRNACGAQVSAAPTARGPQRGETSTPGATHTAGTRAGQQQTGGRTA